MTLAMPGVESTSAMPASGPRMNAALLAARGFPEIAQFDSTVVSTGTWFLAMRQGAAQRPELPPHRDCLVNVDATAQAVPAARFMGGREIDLLCGGAHGIDRHARIERGELQLLGRRMRAQDTVVGDDRPRAASREARPGALA